MIIPIILAGGSGTRLWPLSRKLVPKQFLNLVNETSLLQDTILRLPATSIEPIIICNEEHRFLVAEQCRQINIKPSSIILEPEGKNTAPAITLAAMKIIDEFKDATLLVLPADHAINDINSFHNAILVAKDLALSSKLVTFGVVPDRADIGYGYIETKIIKKADYFAVKSFREKPNLKLAKKYFESKKYLWNSGMFMFKASTFLQDLNKYEPSILLYCKKSLENANKDAEFIRIKAEEFSKCPNKSVDYALMEKSNNSMVVPLNSGWSDVGSWNALIETKSKDINGNVTIGDVITNNVKNSYIHSSNRLVSVSELSDLIIVDTQDALLVTTKNDCDNFKMIFDKVKESHPNETITHRKVYRPWGYYDLVDVGNDFQTKRILVNPGAKLSLQKHRHRAEHWIVVSGIATVTCGNNTFALEKNQSTYIPKGEIHRLENQENSSLEIIEVQTGSYLGEDDIIRLEDDYQRN
jgi:mannose-1-phosphate guanylyltransferase